LGLQLADDLLNEAAHLTRVDIPDVLRWKGIALMKMKRHIEALQVLTEACSLADGMGANFQLGFSLSALADVHDKLKNQKEANAKRIEARKIIEQVAESLREIGLSESFLNQPQVKKLMR
ncbi:MAG: hypothetical protein R3351_09360, partial [Nitrospirales bacterium]|nr:hypothetical protein [Nitrospirales bacterium]